MIDPAVSERIGDALQAEAEAISEQPGAMLNKFYVITEWVAPDGQLWLMTNPQETSTTWDRLGMLEFARLWETQEALSEDE